MVNLSASVWAKGPGTYASEKVVIEDMAKIVEKVIGEIVDEVREQTVGIHQRFLVGIKTLRDRQPSRGHQREQPVDTMCRRPMSQTPGTLGLMLFDAGHGEVVGASPCPSGTGCRGIRHHHAAAQKSS